MASVGASFWHNITHKTANPCPTLPASHVVIYIKPAGCFSRGDEAILRSPEHLWMSDRTQKQAAANAAWATISTNSYLPEMSVNVYIVIV